MKTILKLTSLFAAACIPSAFAAELAGLNLPAGLDPLSAFAAFVLSTVALSFATDYSRRPRLALASPAVAPVAPKAAHALAA